MGLLDLFDEAFDLYKSNFALFLLITAIVYVPVVGIGAYVAAPVLRPLMGTGIDGLTNLGNALRTDMGWTALTLGTSALSTALLLSALVAAACARYKDEPVNLATAYRAALPVTIQATLLLALYAAATIGGTMTCVLPGILVILLSIPLQLFLHVMLNEGVRDVYQPLKRSWKLASGNGSFILGGHIVHWCLWGVLVAAVVGAVEIVANLAVDSAAPFMPLLVLHKEVAESIAFGLSCMLLLPFQVCVVTMFYFDLRIRREGYDIELLARSLGYPPIDQTATTDKAAQP